MQYFVLSKKRTLPELIRLVGHCLVIFFKRFFRAAQEINLIPRDSVQRFFHSINIVR